jgi:L-cystine transport system permease protein
MTLFDFNFFFKSLPAILQRLPVTLIIAVCSFFLAIVLGLVTALIKIYRIRGLKTIAGIYISFIRGTPLLVQLYLVSYGIPKTIHYLQVEHDLFRGVKSALINPLYFAIAAFSVYMGAYLAEAIRSSIEAVGSGQFEAAKSVGMTPWQSMTRIVLPQALSVAIPILGNTFIAAIKGTSFLFTIGVTDMMGQARIIGIKAFSFFEVYVAAAIFYWIICFLFERLFDYLEKWSKRYERTIAQKHG